MIWVVGDLLNCKNLWQPCATCCVETLMKYNSDGLMDLFFQKFLLSAWWSESLVCLVGENFGFEAQDIHRYPWNFAGQGSSINSSWFVVFRSVRLGVVESPSHPKLVITTMCGQCLIDTELVLVNPTPFLASRHKQISTRISPNPFNHSLHIKVC